MALLLCLVCSACAMRADDDVIMTDDGVNMAMDESTPVEVDELPAIDHDGIGQPFEGQLVINDECTKNVDPSTLPQSAEACRGPILARVTRVVDGDTVYVSGESEWFSNKVRLLGVDTPEVAFENHQGECFGDDARAFTQQLEGKLVWLSFDRECADNYGRSLAYVSFGPGEQDVWQRQLIRRGLAQTLVIGGNRALASYLYSDEDQAQATGAGLWTACR